MTRISLYKKVTKCLLEHGFTFATTGSPYIKVFEGKNRLKSKEYRDIKILIGKKEYNARIGATGKRPFKGKTYPNAYRILYSSKDITKEIQKMFISSYIKVMSGKKLTPTNSEEVLEVTPLSPGKIRFTPFVQRKTDYDKLFQKFIDSDVFGWLYFKQKEHLFLKSPNEWISKKKLKDHKQAKYAIYYLLDTKNGKIYVGSAKDLFSRLHSHRPEIPEWDKFRYETLRPDFRKFLHRIEAHTIKSFATIFDNKLKVPSLNLGKYELMNKTLPRL